MTRKLTGRIRYRTSWNGKLILQVEENWEDECMYNTTLNKGRKWRDAKIEDLTVLDKSK